MIHGYLHYSQFILIFWGENILYICIVQVYTYLEWSTYIMLHFGSTYYVMCRKDLTNNCKEELSIIHCPCMYLKLPIILWCRYTFRMVYCSIMSIYCIYFERSIVTMCRYILEWPIVLLCRYPVYTGWGAQSWTVFCGPAAVAIGGCERKD